MNKYKKLLSTASVFCAFFILNLVPGNIFAQLVTNGGFESSNVGDITATSTKGWLIQTAPALTPQPVYEIVSDVVEEGSKALKVSVQGTSSTQWDIQAVADSIPVTPGTVYEYSVWAKSDQPSAQVNFTVGTYANGEIAAIRPATLTTQWKKYTLQFKAPANEKVIRAPIHFCYSANTGNIIYIDNLKIVDVNEGKKPVVVEAESGTIGSNYSTLEDGKVKYITPKTTYAGMTGPGDTSRIATYQVTFSDTGSYSVFVHLRVGSGAYNDDSFFAGKGFGQKSDTASTDWTLMNGLAAAGWADSSQFVDDIGTAGSSVWKWVNVTKNDFSFGKVGPFYVTADSLTKTFQIGSREDGLDIDKLAFGKSYLHYTVNDLDKRLAGSTSTTKPDTTTYFRKGKPIADGQYKFLGNVPSEPPESYYVHYWNQLTPGNAGKWGSIAYTQDTTKWNWSNLDKAYNYAKQNNLIFKDHCLIWGQQQPSWISDLDSAQQVKYIETWIRMVGQRYPKIDLVDVVNEAIAGHNPPDGASGRANYKKALGGSGKTGYDWIINCFQMARKYLPNAKLLINDYGIINDNGSTYIYLQIIKALNDRGLIDGIGVQGHRFELESADTTILKRNLDRLAATGLPIYISEFDLGNTGDTGTPDDNNQLFLYKRVFPVLWKHPGVKGITLWGYMEGQMWQPTCFLVRNNGAPRPALTWMEQFIKDNPATDVEEVSTTLPTNYNLEQNYPNPFNPTTNIRYSITNTTNVTLKIYDFLGREVRTLVSSVQKPGQYTVTFNAQGLASGIYFYKLSAGNFVATKKLMLLK